MVRQKAASLSGIGGTKDIFPVKSYSYEEHPTAPVSILILRALQQALYAAEDYLEGLSQEGWHSCAAPRPLQAPQPPPAPVVETTAPIAAPPAKTDPIGDLISLDPQPTPARGQLSPAQQQAMYAQFFSGLDKEKFLAAMMGSAGPGVASGPDRNPFIRPSAEGSAPIQVQAPEPDSHVPGAYGGLINNLQQPIVQGDDYSKPFFNFQASGPLTGTPPPAPRAPVKQGGRSSHSVSVHPELFSDWAPPQGADWTTGAGESTQETAAIPSTKACSCAIRHALCFMVHDMVTK